MSNQISVPLVGIGGTAPYVFTVVTGSSTTIPATISGSTLTVNAASVEPGNYTVLVKITDQQANVTNSLVSINVVSQTAFAILNRDISFQPSLLPYSGTLALTSVGGNGTITWALIPLVTTLPGASISGSTLSFTIASYGAWTVGLRATDSLGNTVTAVLNLSISSTAVSTVVDGHARLKVSPGVQNIGSRSFTMTVVDSASNSTQKSFTYTVDPPTSSINIPQNTVDHFWSDGDTTTVALELEGNLSGFTLPAAVPVVAGNNLTATLSPATDTLLVTGPPSVNHGNFEVAVPINLVQGSTQVATITKEFSLVDHHNVYAPQYSTIPTTAWQKMSVVFTAASTGSMQIFLNAGVGAVAGAPVVYFDDITVTPAANLLNGGFETGVLTPWVATLGSASTAVVNTTSHTGTYCLSMSPGAYGGAIVSQTITGLTPGTAYTVTCFVMAAAIATNYCYLKVLDSATDIIPNGLGSMTCTTRPYIVGETIGLNPQRPYYNSPTIFKNKSYQLVPSQHATFNTLPLGLSLDSVTGLIYGTLLAGDVTYSALDYVDASGVVQGSVIINWDILNSQFALTDGLPDGQLQAPYTGTITTASAFSLASVSLHRGSLPTGLALGVSGTSITLSGSATTAGFFDLWIKAVNSIGQAGYLHKRLVINFVSPLVFTTGTIQRFVTNTPFTQTLLAYGGIQPYTFAVTSGTLPAGITLNANSGVISGTPTASSYSQNLTFQVTDYRGVTASIVLPATINNTLTITTSVLPQIIPGSNYQFQMQAEGGQGSYTWALSSSSPALPGGFSLSASGLLSGATSLSSYSQNVIIQVTDSASNSVVQAYALQIGAATSMTIDTTGVGPIARGGAYQGTLKVDGPSLAPYVWAVSPGTPNPLPAGLSLKTDSTTLGAHAILSGTTTAVLLNYSVEVQVVDANGNIAYAYLFLNSDTTLLITTTSLPQATVSGTYSVQLTCSGYNPAFTWAVASGSAPLPAGISFTSSGLLYGTPTAAVDVFLAFVVTDSLGDINYKFLEFVSKTSTLAITTTALPSFTAGVLCSDTLAASGGSTPYTWSVSPNSTALLPAGVTLSTNGIISGSTTANGFSKTIIFRVTDSLGVIREVSLPFTVGTSTYLVCGPDSVQNTSNGVFGMVPYIAGGDPGIVSGISPNNQRAFLMQAVNLISTSASGLSFTVPANFSASVVVFNSQYGQALIKLNGPFGSYAVNQNQPFTFVMNDSGVTISTTVSYEIYTQQNIRVCQTTSGAALPTNSSGQVYLPILQGTTGNILISNVPISNTSGNAFNFPPMGQSAITASDYSALTSQIFVLSGDNSGYQGAMYISSNGTTNYQLNLLGTAPPSGVATTNLTITNRDIAWYNSSNKTADLYSVTSTTGGSSVTFLIDWLIQPLISTVTIPSPLPGDGQSHNITVTFANPIPPIQTSINATFTASGGMTVTGQSAIMSNGFITGYTLTVTTPHITTAGTSVSCTLNWTASDTLTFLSGGSVVTQAVTYINTGNFYTATVTGPSRVQHYSNYPASPGSTDGSYLGRATVQGVLCDSFSQTNSFSSSAGSGSGGTGASLSDATTWQKLVYYFPNGAVYDFSDAPAITMFFGVATNPTTATGFQVAIGFISCGPQNNLNTFYINAISTPSTLSANNASGLYGGTITSNAPLGSATISNSLVGNFAANGTATYPGTFYPQYVCGIFFEVAQISAITTIYIGAPATQFSYYANSF